MERKVHEALRRAMVKRYPFEKSIPIRFFLPCHIQDIRFVGSGEGGKAYSGATGNVGNNEDIYVNPTVLECVWILDI